MKKNERIQEQLESWDPQPGSNLPVEYRAFFEQFNAGAYYEAHDVLEHLWLRCTDENRSFYQALIQLAGAFVHFEKHAAFPEHPTHRRRLAPGRRLLGLSSSRLGAYPKIHLRLDIHETQQMCSVWAARTLESEQESPLRRHAPPRLTLKQSD